MRKSFSNSALPRQEPSLYRVSGRSNRDDKGKKSHWGKNEFNSSFPTALLCYMYRRKLKPVYIKMDKELRTFHEEVSVNEIFGISPDDDGIYFSFEDGFTPFQRFVKGQVERSDLVILNSARPKDPWKRALEIKLTALPDNSTFETSEDRYSCEMVFRQPAIIHLALSIASLFSNKRKQLQKILSPVCSKVYNWRSKEDISALTKDFVKVLNDTFLSQLNEQDVFIVQPIWKTVGKANVLHKNCLDVFVWSNFAFTRLFIDSVNDNEQTKGMKRSQRCIFWLARMLYDFAQIGAITPSLIASEMAYELQTDKAFSISGVKSWKYLNSKQLRKPRVENTEIRNIILGGGQNLLSPERRFDTAIVNTPGLFE